MKYKCSTQFRTLIGSRTRDRDSTGCPDAATLSIAQDYLSSHSHTIAVQWPISSNLQGPTSHSNSKGKPLTERSSTSNVEFNLQEPLSISQLNKIGRVNFNEKYNLLSLYICPCREDRALLFMYWLNMMISKLCFFQSAILLAISNQPQRLYWKTRKRVMLQEKTWKVSGNCHFLMLWGNCSQVPSPPAPRGLWTALTSSSIYSVPNSFGTSVLRVRSKSFRQCTLWSSIISHILFYL